MMGYMWVDLIKPQNLSYSFMASKPLSMIIAVVCITSIFINFKKLNSLENKKVTILLLTFALWITITSSQALFPEIAWGKWDWAFKTIIIAVITPFTIKNRADLEAFLWIFLASVSFFTISAGAKTFLGGGGYGASLISGGNNTGLSESSTLALAAVMSLPLFTYLINNTMLFTKTKSYKFFLFALICTGIFTVIGSYARTGLIGLGVLCVFMFMNSKHKIRLSALIVIAVILILSLASDAWFDRMGTVENASEDSSALGRIVVWKWTVFFANSHFFGGGFHAYIANAGLLDLYHDNPYISFGLESKAFHSVYFEVLGEHGYIGLLIFLSIIGTLFIQLRHIAKVKANTWEGDLSKGLLQSLWVFCACASFVGVAFQPLLYILITLVVSLSNIKGMNE